VLFNDKDLSIDWRLQMDAIRLSDKDKAQPALRDIDDLFE